MRETHAGLKSIRHTLPSHHLLLGSCGPPHTSLQCGLMGERMLMRVAPDSEPEVGTEPQYRRRGEAPKRRRTGERESYCHRQGCKNRGSASLYYGPGHTLAFCAPAFSQETPDPRVSTATTPSRAGSSAQTPAAQSLTASKTLPSFTVPALRGTQQGSEVFP